MKSIQEIYEEMRHVVQERGGVSVSESGELSLRLYAIAYELYALYAQADWVRRQCFPQTAAEGQLDEHAALRGLLRLEAAKAAGIIRFSVEQASTQTLTIPEGTACLTVGQQRFVTTEAAELAPGALYVDVAAQAETAGAAGNVSAGEILIMSAPPYGVTACYNQVAFSGGRDTESDEALRARILESYAQLQNGANTGYYQSVAKSFDTVVAAEIFPVHRGANTLDVVIATAEGVADEETIAAVSSAFEERRELGIDVLVRAPEIAQFDPVIYLMMEEGGDFDAAREVVAARLLAALDGTTLGKVITGDVLTGWIGSVEGVRGYTVTEPEFFDPQRDRLPRIGSLEIINGGTVSEA